MNLTSKLILGFIIGIVIGGIVGFYGALVKLPVELTAGIIGPLTAAIVAVVLLSE
jgi:ABC-type microcin C transport system permease subunit YejE